MGLNLILMLLLIAFGLGVLAGYKLRKKQERIREDNQFYLPGGSKQIKQSDSYKKSGSKNYRNGDAPVGSPEVIPSGGGKP